MNFTHWAPGIPRAEGWLHDARLMSDPYRYLSVLMARQGCNALQLRLMGEPTLCMAGAEAVTFFYDSEQIQRQGAAPEPLRATLFGKGGVQGLDGAAHRHRKAVFLQVMAPASVAALVARTRREWLAALPHWQLHEDLNLYRALQRVLTVAVCDWAGLPLDERESGMRMRQLVSMFDDAARGLRGHLRARARRAEAESWACQRIEAVRAGTLQPPPASALAVLAWHRNEHGQLLPPRLAAVELLNVLRPVVAVSVFMVFVAHALDGHPEYGERLRARPRGTEALQFVQEVRRHYPFFPALLGRARAPACWQSSPLPQGMRVLLDVHGTNHSPHDWADPHLFLPERWRAFPHGSPPAFVPQGGASVERGHRCPGEDAAIQLMLLALEVLLVQMRYEAAPHRPPLDYTRLPALPENGMRIAWLRTVSAFRAVPPWR
jgi:fatty-acid peroxygenase